jgi:hypothetical protein
MRVTRGFSRGWLKFPGSCHPSVLSGERGRHSNKTGSTVPSVISAMSEGEKRFMKDGNPCMTEKLTKQKPIAWLSWGCGFERCLQDSRQRVLLSHTGIEKQGIVNHSEEAAFLPLAFCSGRKHFPRGGNWERRDGEKTVIVAYFMVVFLMSTVHSRQLLI